MTATMPFRAIRAAAFAAVSVALGVGAHAVGGGSVSVVAVLMALLIAFLPAHALARRERTLAVILPALVASQAALHLLFSFVHTLEPSVAGSAMSGGHVHSGLVPGLGMLVMHGWAVALTAVWLAHGEALLWALLRRLAVQLRIVFAVFLDPAYGAIVVPVIEHRVVARSVLLGHSMGRRGPPGTVRTVPA
ncbi:MFS transporter [Microbispora hainanensis]|uniref:MFS transporter n=1 Tax=Microbispora TaxID=2005 RepID=UPI0011577414|nr:MULTISPECIES: MFS transporter [Microbispora]NJP29555.1 MFS transporter [Microbispora sp. CL1-1]TQS05021.1 MFS transporter [Microbispora sp. SCL1-1]